MTATETKPTITPDKAYELVLKGITDRGDMAATKVNSLVRSRHNVTLADYHASVTIPDAEKIEFYRECVRAIVAAPAKPAGIPAGKTTKELFVDLCNAIRSAPKGDDVPKKIAAHLRATTGRVMSLAIYNNDPAVPDADKSKLYRECLAAISGDLSKLKGDVGKGDKRVEPDPLETSVVAPPEPVAAKRPAPEPVAPIDPDSDDAVEQALKLLASRSSKPKVDESAVRRIVDDVVADALTKVNDAFEAVSKRLDSTPKSSGVDEAQVLSIIKRAMGNGEFPTTRVESIVDDRIKALSPAELSKAAAVLAESTLASYIPEVDPVFVVSPEQKAFLKHIHKLSRKQIINVNMVGPHGCGKSTLPTIMAAEYKMPILIMDCANIREPRDWFGYKYTEAGDVKWHRSQFDRCISAGNHIIVLDELPRSTDQIRNVLMPLLDDRRKTFLEERGEYVTVGAGTIIFATANEGMAYTGCSALDIALDDRLTRRVEVSYLSPADEAKVSARPDWHRRCQCAEAG